MPEMGEGVIEGTVARWLKNEGEEVKQDEPLLEIETDKVTTEAAAEADGILSQIMIPEGETVAVGTVLGVIGVSNGQPAKPVPAPQAIPENKFEADLPAEQQAVPEMIEFETKPEPKTAVDQSPGKKNDLGWISPVVSRMAEEHNLDLQEVTGSGKNGRITKRDVQAFLDTQSQPTTTQYPPSTTHHPSPTTHHPPPVTPHPSPTGDLIPHTSLRRAIADHMVMSKKTSPHVTTIFEVDFSAVWSHRAQTKAEFAKKGVKLTFTPYLILAITGALQAHPQVNSSWQDDGLLVHQSINIGMATALENGLIVPVIKGADGYNLLGMARAVNDLAGRARANQLKPAEVTEGTFTLTNHGVSGSLFATPIINQPQCGILGVGKIQKRVVVETDSFGNDAMVIKPMAYLSFAFDHRILDGVSADRFVAEVKQILQAWAPAT